MGRDIPHYGVWVAQPIRYHAQTPQEDARSPHIYLYFKDDSQSHQEKEAAINVKSLDQDSRLVFWLNRNFTHPITQQLQTLNYGFQLANAEKQFASYRFLARYHHHHHHGHGQGQGQGQGNNDNNRGGSGDSTNTGSNNVNNNNIQGLDFLRTPNLVDLKSGRLLPADAAGPNNDILDELEPILTDAINKNAKMYIWGSSYGSGIHDVHMNQGSLPKFENGVYEDGAILFQFDDGHWEAVFLAFASQKVPTDDRTGEPVAGSRTLASILGQE